MPADHSTPQPPTDLSKTDPAVPDAVIEDFLGLGLAYSEWPAEVEKRGHVWFPGLEKTIIEKELEFFKPEIQLLRLEPKIAQSSRSKSNSLASILKRLKGEPWVEGRPDEREERLRTHRLLGKDAKIRCLQKYVHDWDQEAALASSTSVQNATVKSAAGSGPSQPPVPDNPTLEIGSCYSPPEIQYSNGNPEPEARLTPGIVDINTDTLHSIYICPSQLASSMAPLLTQSGPSSVTNSDFSLLPAFQNAVPLPDIEASRRYLESELSDTFLKSPAAFSRDTNITSFDDSPIGEDDVPISANYSQGFDLSEPEPNVIDWMETNQVSENFEPAETEAPHPDAAFQGTFLNDNFSFRETAALETGLTKNGMSTDLPRQHNSHPGCLEFVSQPISSPRSSSKSRKRRRQNTSEASLDLPGYENTTIPATSHGVSDCDTIMSGYESGSQNIKELVSQESWTQPAPPSRPLPTPPCSGITSTPAYTQVRRQIELELELQRTRRELSSERKLRQKELESFVRKQQAAEDEISELREQLREMQQSTEEYERLAHGLISENIILQEANSRKKSISSLPPTSTKEREHSTKPVQSFPSSKNPRPLSLTFRTATASKASSSPPRKLSASTLQDTSTLQRSIVTSSSSRSSSPDNNQVSSENAVLAHVAHKSTCRRSRPGSPDSSQVSSGQPVPASSPSKLTGRNNWSGSADSIAAPTLSTSTRRDPTPLQQFMHKISNPFLRKQSRDDYSKAVQTIPILPPLKASVPLKREMAGVLIDGDKRLTNDSGYDSLRFETSSRASVADPE